MLAFISAVVCAWTVAVSVVAPVVATSSVEEPAYLQHQGFIGTYHTASGEAVADGTNRTSAWESGR